MKLYIIFPAFFFCLLLGGHCTAADAGSPMQICLDDKQVSITHQGKPLLIYCYKGVPFKPYVQQLYSLNGKNVLRDNVADHLHHHGLMMATSVNEITYWEETEKSGRQIHQSFSHVCVDGQKNTAVFMENLNWTDPDGAVSLTELRTLSAKPYPENNTVILSWRSQLQCPESQPKAIIGGAHYYGMGMRFPASMDAIGTFSNSYGKEGRIFRGEERLVESYWCAYTVNEPKPLTVCMFDDPNNSKPVTWFTMPKPFAYLSATLLYHENPIELQSMQTLDLQYAVAVIDGIATKETIVTMYETWIQK